MRSSTGLKPKVAKARFAAATAFSTSACVPSEICAKANSSDGSITSMVFGTTGSTQAPSI